MAVTSVGMKTPWGKADYEDSILLSDAIPGSYSFVYGVAF